MKFITIPVVLLSLSLLIACGSQQPANTPAAKRAVLKEKKAQLLALNKEISQLEEELNEADPTATTRSKVVAITTQLMEPVTFEHFVEVQGKVEANNSVTVSPQSSGRLVKVTVQEGQAVKSGQILARIDDAVMRRNIEEIKTQLELAEIMFQKQENLWNQKIGTEVQYLSAKNQKESLQRRLETLQEQQDLTVVKAPMSGTIDRLLAREGETVAPGQPLFQLVNNADLNLLADLSEAYAPYVRRGDQVKVSFPILDRQFGARVKRVGQVIDPTNRTFPVEVSLPNSADYKPNMYGQLAINDRSIKDALVIPQGVVQQSDDGTFVYVAEPANDGWVARRRIIKTGLDYQGQVLVTEGLRPKDRLVVAGYKNLSDGQVVTLTDDTIAKK
jgi:RND family efflux transporter MFP subunit